MHIQNNSLTIFQPFIKYVMTHYGHEDIQEFSGYVNSGQIISITTNEDDLIAEIVYVKRHWFSKPLIKIKTYSTKYNRIDINNLLKE